MSNTSWMTGPPTIGTDATFRAWGSGISTAMTAIGMTQLEQQLWPVPPGGAFSWGTVTHPVVVNTERCYEIWKFTNETSPRSPLYVRLGYGSYAAISYPRLTIDVGTGFTSIGSGGTGLLTGVVASVVASYNGGGGTVGALGSWAACDGDGFVFSHCISNGGVRSMWWVDRVRDPATGDVLLTAEGDPVGVQVGAFVGSTVTSLHVDLVTGQVFTTTLPPVITFGGLSTSLAKVDTQGRVQLFPWWSALPSGQGVSKMVASVNQADMLAGSSQAVGWLPPSTSRVVKAIGSYILNAATCDAESSVGGSMVTWWADS